MYKRICFLYTETTGLHKTYEAVSKKKLFCFARLVSLNYEIGYYKDGEWISEKNIRKIAKPRCMVIPKETVQYHGITQDIANKEGIDPEIIMKTFKDDLKTVDIIVSHNIDFHFKTIIAEAMKYNIILPLSGFLNIDTVSFYHQFKYVKLKDLADKLNLKLKKSDSTLETIKKCFFKLYNNFINKT